jgi:hypothetical protein
MSQTNNPLDVQIGGDHYANKAIQPIEFSMANRLDGCAHSITKYLTRHPEKGGRADVEKAFHFVQLREMLATEKHLVRDWVVSMDEYCRANQLPELETSILLDLALWLESHSPMYPHRMKIGIQTLLLQSYSTTD